MVESEAAGELEIAADATGTAALAHIADVAVVPLRIAGVVFALRRNDFSALGTGFDVSAGPGGTGVV